MYQVVCPTCDPDVMCISQQHHASESILVQSVRQYRDETYINAIDDSVHERHAIFHIQWKFLATIVMGWI